MPTRNISLTKQQDAFIARVVKSGEYQNASEAVRAGVRILQEHRHHEALKLKALRAAIKVGTDDLARGDYVEVKDGDLEGFLDSLTPPRRKRIR